MTLVITDMRLQMTSWQ